MKRISFKYITLVALVLFVSGLGIRRYMLRDQIDKLGRGIEQMRSQDELQENMNDLMASFLKSDADLKTYVIARNPEALKGFGENISSLEMGFESFKQIGIAQNILTKDDAIKIDSLVHKKLLLMMHIKELCTENQFSEAEQLIAMGMGIVLMDTIWNVMHRSNDELALRILASELDYRNMSAKEQQFSIWSFVVLIILLIGFLYFLYREMERNERAKKQLYEREEKLSVTLAGISDGVLTTDERGHINYLNPVAENLLACTLEEVSGKQLEEVYRISDEETGSRIGNIFEEVVLEGHKIERRNHTILRTMKDETCVIENSATPLRNYNEEIIGMVLVFRDVTSQKDNVEARLEAERDFRVIFENTQEGIYRSTLYGQLTLVNPSMVKIFEFDTAEEMIAEVNDIGRQLFLDGETRQNVVSRLTSDGKIVGFEFKANTRKGRVIWIRLNAHVSFDSHGEIAYVEGSVTDVTQRKTDQENLQRQFEALKQYAFINSHEVRSHVATMLGLMNLCIAKYVSEDEKDDILNHLYDETSKLDDVIRKLSKLINE